MIDLRTTRIMLVLFLFVANQVLAQTSVIEYTSNYIYIKNTATTDLKMAEIKFSAELMKPIRKVVKGVKSQSAQETLRNYLPSHYRSLILVFWFKTETATPPSETVVVNIADFLGNANVVETNGLTVSPKSDEVRQGNYTKIWSPVILIIGKSIEISKENDGSDFIAKAYYPNHRIDSPWMTKNLIKKDGPTKIKTDGDLMKDGFKLENLTLQFKADAKNLKNVKLYFDSYYGALIDETFLGMLSQRPSQSLMKVSFSGYMLDEFIDTKMWMNETPGDTKSFIEPTDQYRNSQGAFYKKISIGDYLTMNDVLKPFNMTPMKVELLGSLGLVKKDSDSIGLDLTLNSYNFSFWFMLKIDINEVIKQVTATEDSFKQNIIRFNFKVNKQTSLDSYFIRLVAKIKKEQFEALKAQVSQTDTNNYKPISFPLFLEYKHDDKGDEVSIPLTQENVNSPFNKNYMVTEKKWYFISMSIGIKQNFKTEINANLTGNHNEIDFHFTISNSRETESVQLYFPPDKLEKIKIPMHLHTLEFKFIGKLTLLNIIQDNFDYRNSHSSITNNGLHINNCQQGLYYKRIALELSALLNEYVYEEDLECFQCLGVTGDRTLHSKKTSDVKFEGYEAIPLVWDGQKCSFNCPKGYSINYRLNKCDNCFLNQCLEAKNTENQATGPQINYITELTKTAECGDDIVEYDKGEQCEAKQDGCNHKDCKSKNGHICFSPVLGNSKCLKCHDPEAESICKSLYIAPDKTFEQLKILSNCVSKCEYSEGSYPVQGFIRSTWGKQTFKNEEGVEKLCFLTYLNIEERNRKIFQRNKVQPQTNVINKKEISIRVQCEVECQLRYEPSLDMCFNFHHNLGYDERADANWLYKFSLFIGLIVMILTILSLCFLAPAGNIQLFFMQIDFLQLYHIWGLRAKKSFTIRRMLKNLRFVSFEFNTTSWLATVLSRIFQLQNFQLVNPDYINKITDYEIKTASSPIFAYEDYLQYNKTGLFMIDCSHIIEAYLYYSLTCLLLKGVYALLKKIVNKNSALLVGLRNMKDFVVSRNFLFRIINETYIYLLLYGLYMELNVFFPIKTTNVFILSETYVIANKIIMRVMVVVFGFGFPAYLIARILLYGKGEKIDTDLKFMIDGCKISAKSARIIPILIIIRKIMVVLYVLPCFRIYSMQIALLVVLIQVSILTFLVNGFPFKTLNMNFVALVTNFMFLVTSWVFFINEITTNFLELSYITTEDFGANQMVQDDTQSSYQIMQDKLNILLTSTTIFAMICVFVLGILIQVIDRIKFNKEFYGSIFSNKNQSEQVKRKLMNTDLNDQNLKDQGWNDIDQLNEDADNKSQESYDEAVERMGGKNAKIFELMAVQQRQTNHQTILITQT